MNTALRNKRFNINYYQILIIILIITGIGLRVLFFSYHRSLWNDEAALALNIIRHWNYFSPLEYSQACPQLFMYLTKVLFLFLPDKTIALRFIPFISSILSLFVFFLLSLKFLHRKISVVISIALFSCCYPLCYYAQEFKQYSSDVLAFLVVILSYFYIDKIIKGSKILKLLAGIGYSFFVWLSFSTVFALFSVFITTLIFHREKLKQLLLPVCITVINTGLLIISNLHLCSNNFLHVFWADAFVNKGVMQFLQLNIQNLKYVFNTPVSLFFIIVSLIFISIKELKDEKNILLIMPLCLVFFLSYIQLYPYSTRLILFLIPIFILLYSKFTDYVHFDNKFMNLFSRFCIILFIFPVLLQSENNIVQKNYAEENIIIPLQITAKEAKPDDTVYISDGNAILYEYYRSLIPLNNNVYIEQERYNDNREYIKHLDTLNKGKTYYWLLAHHPKKFERLKLMYLWAKDKENFKLYTDNKGNALIRFTMD